ncbi:MAG: cupin domain-containing protein [Polyangiaceae bacterium]
MNVQIAPMTPALTALVAGVASRVPLGEDAAPGAFTHDGLAPGRAMYRNQNERLGIDFAVERVPFPHLCAMDPRIVRIAPARNNERHRHAHESIFVVLAGRGEVLVGERWSVVKAGDIAFVPRWIFHQTRNTSEDEELVVLAITDFGLTSACLGDYDRRTRLAANGDDAVQGSP